MLSGNQNKYVYGYHIHSGIWMVILFISFLSCLYDEHLHLKAEVMTAALSQPPMDCRPLNELSFLERFEAPSESIRLERCALFMQKLTQSTFPNPIVTLCRLFSQIYTLPIMIFMESTADTMAYIIEHLGFMNTIFILLVFSGIIIYALIKIPRLLPMRYNHDTNYIQETPTTNTASIITIEEA